MNAIEVDRARKHGDAVVVVWVLAGAQVGRIEVIHHGVGHHHIYPAQLIDELDQAVQPDPRVVVHMDFEVALHRGDRRGRATELERGADLAGALVRDGNPEVAWDREHGRLPGRRIDAQQDHRLGVQPVRRELGVVVRSQEQDGERGRGGAQGVEVRHCAGGGRRARDLEHRQEVGSKAEQAGQQEAGGNDQDTWQRHGRALHRSNA